MPRHVDLLGSVGLAISFVSRLHSATHMASLLVEGLAHGFETLREKDIEQMRRRHEVLQ